MAVGNAIIIKINNIIDMGVDGRIGRSIFLLQDLFSNGQSQTVVFRAAGAGIGVGGSKFLNHYAIAGQKVCSSQTT
ncbi:hypothetical protein CHH28_04685 [Bacterioplanes sanyensis]|uniref:Uncharacterized protein n=1 Tax=Bacterioplanes sanyensis TaxID=1249553 RepID=A0A222FGZ0_9GAMM|nr:hypothetical protein CHH28_04685 [Bacterioplanes sanyensis]